MTNQSLTAIEEVLWPRGEKRDVWMILDAARDRAAFRMLLECGLEYSCLYSGTIPPALEIVAPYLVQLEYQDRSTRRFLEQGWGNSWDILLKCDSGLPKLRRHLRQFLVVRDPQGKRLVFRYYDPRVLRVYLPTCSTEELRTVFGPIQCFWTEGKIPENMLEFRFNQGKLVHRTLSLAAGVSERNWGLEVQRDDVPPADAPRLAGLLAVRAAQIAALSQAEVQKFEDWMIAHIRQFFSKQCGALQESQLRELIQYGIKRAANHGIVSERDVCKFIDLMIVFGRDFDTDKQLPWAGRILANRRTARSKIRSLYEAAEAHVVRP
jgi:hypothetical protein